MIKTSKHNISNISNQGKLTSLDWIYLSCLKMMLRPILIIL